MTGSLHDKRIFKSFVSVLDILNHRGLNHAELGKDYRLYIHIHGGQPTSRSSDLNDNNTILETK